MYLFPQYLKGKDCQGTNDMARKFTTLTGKDAQKNYLKLRKYSFEFSKVGIFVAVSMY